MTYFDTDYSTNITQGPPISSLATPKTGVFNRFPKSKSNTKVRRGKKKGNQTHPDVGFVIPTLYVDSRFRFSRNIRTSVDRCH